MEFLIFHIWIENEEFCEFFNLKLYAPELKGQVCPALTH